MISGCILIYKSNCSYISCLFGVIWLRSVWDDSRHDISRARSEFFYWGMLTSIICSIGHLMSNFLDWFLPIFIRRLDSENFWLLIFYLRNGHFSHFWGRPIYGFDESPEKCQIRPENRKLKVFGIHPRHAKKKIEAR